MTILPPVHFDQHAAARAAAACREAGRSIQDTLVPFRAEASIATASWTGRFRRDFDRDLATRQRQAEQLVWELFHLALQIESAMDDAATEQRRRDRHNEREREQRRREQERRAARARADAQSRSAS